MIIIIRNINNLKGTIIITLGVIFFNVFLNINRKNMSNVIVLNTQIIFLIQNALLSLKMNLIWVQIMVSIPLTNNSKIPILKLVALSTARTPHIPWISSIQLIVAKNTLIMLLSAKPLVHVDICFWC